ncbi:MAG: glycosyl hydrolase family 65 protein [Rhizomicrobium sp.]
MSDTWKVQTDRFANDGESIMRNGNIYQLANGYMGYRGTLDEFGPDEMVAVTLAGLYDQVGDAWREPVNAPNGGFTRIAVDGAGISARTTPIRSHRQSIDLRKAVFERETVFDLSGALITIRSVRFLSADDPHLGVVRYSVTCDRAAGLRIETGIDGGIWDLNGPHLPELRAEIQDGVLLMSGLASETARKVVVAELCDFDFGVQEHLQDRGKNLRIVELRAAAGRTYTFDKYFAVYTGNDRVAMPIESAAVAAVKDARSLGYARCQERHGARWSDKWAASDVTIEGDDEAQLALRYSIFQLLLAAPVEGSGNSIPARALSGQAYKGAVFWDTETFMLPFFLHTCPAKAAELLRYRIRTLDGARRKARTEGAGYRGAFYAWESQETGDDACSYFNIGDPLTKRELRTHFRDKQIHISGDVAIAMWEYFRLTGDDTLLLEGGAEVILECARFYYSYAYFKRDKNRYEILDVIGPDEYHERVNNNAFTNRVAKATFEIAGATIAHLRAQHPARLEALVGKIGIAQELALLAEAGRLLYVPEPDPKSGLIEQFEGYFNLKDVAIAELEARRIHPDEYLGAGQGLAVPTKVIKQADVVMLLALFKSGYSPDVMRANWRYYEPRTEHGSSLSASAYALVAAEFGDLENAYRYFMKTATIDLEARYKVFAGTVFMSGSHPAANGGAWMACLFGFAGLAADEKQVSIAPRLYETWRSLSFQLTHRGGRYAVWVSPEHVTVAAAATNRQAGSFAVWGRVIECRPGESCSWEARSSSGVAASGRHLRA